MRKFGLSVDNVVDAQLIDVNGKLLDQKSMGEDLFWAITGGGGANFGVLLAYNIKPVRVPTVVTVFNIQRTSKQNLNTIAKRWIQVAYNLDNDIFLQMILDVIMDINGQKTMRAIFPTFYLGNSTTLVTLLNKDFPELGLEKSNYIEMSWIESVFFYTNFSIFTPTNALLRRTPQILNPFKNKSDYVKIPISKQGFEFIFENMKELEIPKLLFNPYGGRMSEISECAKPFRHRSVNITNIQYLVYWEDLGKQVTNQNLNLSRIMYDYMTPFIFNNPREAYLNYRDLDIGVNDHGKNAYFEGTQVFQRDKLQEANNGED